MLVVHNFFFSKKLLEMLNVKHEKYVQKTSSKQWIDQWCTSTTPIHVFDILNAYSYHFNHFQIDTSFT